MRSKPSILEHFESEFEISRRRAFHLGLRGVLAVRLGGGVRILGDGGGGELAQARVVVEEAVEERSGGRLGEGRTLTEGEGEL